MAIKSYLKLIFHPYIHASRDIKNACQGVAGSVRTASDGIKSQRKALRERINNAQEIDGKARFEEFYVENEWTQEALDDRIHYLNRSKWMCRAFSLVWLAIAFVIFQRFPTLIGGLFGLTFLLAMVVYLIRVFKTCLFITQLQERNLMTAKDYFSRKSLWSDILFR